MYFLLKHLFRRTVPKLQSVFNLISKIQITLILNTKLHRTGKFFQKQCIDFRRKEKGLFLKVPSKMFYIYFCLFQHIGKKMSFFQFVDLSSNNILFYSLSSSSNNLVRWRLRDRRITRHWFLSGVIVGNGFFPFPTIRMDFLLFIG